MKNIARGILYIGVDDKELDLFESQYVVPEGMSYNSYFIEDDKLAIMDSVDSRMTVEWLAQVEEVLQGRQPDYLVVHHMEPDHSGSIAAFVSKYPGVTIVASAMALKYLEQFFPDFPFAHVQAVKEGDELVLGTHTLRFIAAPMVHWPEVITSYETSTGTYFSADAFGKFGVLGNEIIAGADYDWACEARRYYFNICGKYGAQVTALLKKVTAASASAGLNSICPLHGPVLQETVPACVDLYATWSAYEPETEGVFIAYASIHGGTAAAALTLAELLRKAGVKVAVSDLCRCDRAEAVEDAFRYSKMVVAAATYDAGLFTPAYDFLHTLQVKGYQNRKVALMENGTWAPIAGKVMTEMFSAMKNISFIGETLSIKSVINSQDRPKLEALAQAIVQA